MILIEMELDASPDEVKRVTDCMLDLRLPVKKREANGVGAVLAAVCARADSTDMSGLINLPGVHTCLRGGACPSPNVYDLHLCEFRDVICI